METAPWMFWWYPDMNYRCPVLTITNLWHPKWVFCHYQDDWNGLDNRISNRKWCTINVWYFAILCALLFPLVCRGGGGSILVPEVCPLCIQTHSSGLLKMAPMPVKQRSKIWVRRSPANPQRTGNSYCAMNMCVTLKWNDLFSFSYVSRWSGRDLFSFRYGWR